MKLRNWFTFVLLMLIAMSCSNSDDVSLDASLPESGPKIKVRLGTVGAVVTNSKVVAEKIKSLRIVMLSDGFVEYNSRIDYSDTTKASSTFSETLERTTVAGNKKFYVFANEESVGKLDFSGVTKLPDWMGAEITLTDFLNHYTKDKLPPEGTLGYNNSGSGGEFEELINAAYFQPEYNVARNEIYLPYTAVYSGYKATDDPELTLEASLFMVPVATKFTFNFKNYRQEKVQLYEIRLSKVNKHNFVMASLHESELEKTLHDASYYWIDWLKEVSAGSQLAGGSSSYNDQAGWIENYFMPAAQGEVPVLQEVSMTPNADETWSADALTNIEAPSIIQIIRYFPESLNFEGKTVLNSEKNVVQDIERQIYNVRFTVQEIRNDGINTEKTTSEWMNLDMVKSLFRNTHVVVNVDMYESVVEIYCEVEQWNWNRTPYIGYVQEDDDDD